MVNEDSFFTLFPVFKKDSGLGKSILDQAQSLSCAENSNLYFSGDTCSQIAFIVSGEIRVFRRSETGREITLYEIGPGDTCILNASCILSGHKYPADAITTCACELLMLPASFFRQLVDEKEVMRTYVFSLLSERMADVMTLLDEVVFSRMDERVIDYLIEKSDEGQLSTTHQVIASDLGTSREVVSRLLKGFEKKGKVALARNHIRIINLP